MCGRRNTGLRKQIRIVVWSSRLTVDICSPILFLLSICSLLISQHVNIEKCNLLTRCPVGPLQFCENYFSSPKPTRIFFHGRTVQGLLKVWISCWSPSNICTNLQQFAKILCCIAALMPWPSDIIHTQMVFVGLSWMSRYAWLVCHSRTPITGYY